MTSYNLSAFAGAGAQFFDNNGNPLVGGKIYTYVAGTTTPIATYTTSAGTVANTNPIILDSGGRTTNEIWQAIGTAVKYVLYTSTSTLIGTYDNVPSINDPYNINNQLGSVAGTNAITATASPTLTAYVTGAIYSFIAVNTNTAAATLSIDGLPAKSITINGTAASKAGNIQAGKVTLVTYDGVTFQLLNNVIWGGSQSGGTMDYVTATNCVWNYGSIYSLFTPLATDSGGTGLASSGAAGNVLVSNGTIWTSQSMALPVTGTVSGLKVNASSTTAVVVTASTVVLNSTYASYAASSVNVTINPSTSGANGLDTGTVASATWYSVWVIYNGTTVAGLLSTSATAPTLPSGYTHKARVGWVQTGTAPAFLPTIQYGRRAQYVSRSAGMWVMASGAAALWTTVATGGFVPTTASTLYFTVAMQSSAGSVAVSANNTPSSVTTGGVVQFTTNGTYVSYANLNGSVVLESTNIYWYSVGASNVLYIQGWDDNF